MGVDIGTSGVRAAAFDLSGMQIGFDYKEYNMICKEGGVVELSPEEIYKSFIDVIRGCVKKGKFHAAAIQAVGLSAQMHSFMCIDKDGNALTNLIPWVDRRSLEESRFIEDEYDCHYFYRKTGCRFQHPIYHISKILWFQKNQPKLFEKVSKIVSIKEYILYKLFGEYLIDITDASTTAYFNVNTFQWDDEILNNILHMKPDMFGEPVDCTHIFKGLKKSYANAMGILEGTPFVIGSGDGILANVGCGGVDNKTMSCTIGTSGALRIAVDKPVFDEEGKTWCYCFTKDQWVAGGAINNGGIILKWFRDQYPTEFAQEAKMLGVSSVYDVFNHYAAQIPPGSNGLFFLPYLTGERSPGWHAEAKGHISGLTLLHDKRHIIKAAMEGVIFNLYSLYEVIKRLNGEVDSVIANGGYVNSNEWLQIHADIFNTEIKVASVGEASVYGAAFTAMVAVGEVKGYHDLLPNNTPTRKIIPNKENSMIYANAYHEFKGLYEKLIK
jgi:gluconokinase